MSTSRASRAGGGVVAGATTIYMSSKGVGPNSTAAQNTYAIQAALAACNAAGGGTVVLDRPGVYLVNDIIKADTSTVNYTLNSALVIYSNTTLMLADGVTIKLADASNVYTLRNSGGGNTASGGTTTANSNISVVGGKWDFNYANQTNDPRGLMYWKFHGMWFDYVNGLMVDQTEMVGGKKFCIWQTNCTRIRQSRIYIHATNSDGIHTGGGCSDVVIRDCQLTCPDNALPIITNEGGYYTSLSNVYLDAPHGATSRVTFSGNYTPSCPIAPYRLAGSTSDDITDVVIENFSGSTSGTAFIEVIDDTVVTPNITGALVKRLSIRTGTGTVSTTDGNLVRLAAAGVRSVRIDGCTSPGSVQSLLRVTSASTAVDSISINGCVDDLAYRGSLLVEASASVGHLAVSNSTFNLGVDGRAVQADGTITRLSMSGCTVKGPPSGHSSDAVVRLGSGGVITYGSISGCSISNVTNQFDASNTALSCINFSGNTLTGRSTAVAYILYNRSTSAIVYIGGDGNQYTDWSNGSGGWHNNGVNSFAVSPGYTRIRNLSLYIDGRAVQSAAMPSSNEQRGDCFFNTGGTNNGGVTWSTMYGKVHNKSGTWTFW